MLSQLADIRENAAPLAERDGGTSARLLAVAVQGLADTVEALERVNLDLQWLVRLLTDGGRTWH